MPKLLIARAPLEPKEEQPIRKLAGDRHAPADRITRAKMIVGSWKQKRTTIIAQELGCHPETVRERIVRFNRPWGMESDLLTGADPNSRIACRSETGRHVTLPETKQERHGRR